LVLTLLVFAPAEAGGDDMFSSDFEHAARITDTAASKNNNFFISFFPSFPAV
jgi:hypothetical protein